MAKHVAVHEAVSGELDDLANAIARVKSLMFDINGKPYPALVADNFVDQGSRLRACKNLVEDLDKQVTQFMLAGMGESNELEGTVMLACRQGSVRECLDTERVKKHLGKLLPKFIKQVPIVALAYKVRASRG